MVTRRRTMRSRIALYSRLLCELGFQLRRDLRGEAGRGGAAAS